MDNINKCCLQHQGLQTIAVKIIAGYEMNKVPEQGLCTKARAENAFLHLQGNWAEKFPHTCFLFWSSTLLRLK
jgi:hypothetical protein